MTATLVAPDHIISELQAAAFNDVETAGVILASIVPAGNSLRLLAREIHWVDESAYAVRAHNSLRIASDGYVQALARAERIGAAAIWLHTHPGMDSLPEPSRHDKIVDDQLADLFRIRTGSPYYGALIVSPTQGDFTFTGHLLDGVGAPIDIGRLWSVGNRLRLRQSLHSLTSGLSPAFDRNVRAFGMAVQHTLNQLRVAIVGCGGTGSAVAEQLVRLGVRQFLLIDPDHLSASNVTRVYGSGLSDVDKPKVDVLASHLGRIAPDTIVDSTQGMITVEGTARKLTASDVIFGCTDDNAGRLVLSRLATYFLTPVFDCGVLLTSSEDGTLTGIDGRVTVLVPGQACLVCRGRIDLARAAAELLTPEERSRRVDEGYAPGLGRTEPAVVTFTTAAAAAAVSELLERLIGFGTEPRPSEMLLRYHEREISTNLAEPNDHHYCAPSAGKLGIGLTQPFLELAWPA